MCVEKCSYMHEMVRKKTLNNIVERINVRVINKTLLTSRHEGFQRL